MNEKTLEIQNGDLLEILPNSLQRSEFKAAGTEQDSGDGWAGSRIITFKVDKNRSIPGRRTDEQGQAEAGSR